MLQYAIGIKYEAMLFKVYQKMIGDLVFHFNGIVV
jgi:hypothetical protein